MFLTRAHAQGWETETLSYREAQAISQCRRASGNIIDNRSQLTEVRDRDDTIAKLQRQKKKKQNADAIKPTTISETDMPNLEECVRESKIPFVFPPVEPIIETTQPKKPVPYVRVDDYEDLKRKGGLW